LSQESSTTATHPQLAEITTRLVKLHAEFYGRGPTKAKSYAVNETIMCMLRGGFTEVEITLMAEGRWEDVERMRRAFQETMRDRFVAAVEEVLDRKVEAYLSQISADPQIAIEVFVLVPSGEPIIGEHVFEAGEEEVELS
jgi:uncharacterized protein YbcI